MLVMNTVQEKQNSVPQTAKHNEEQELKKPIEESPEFTHYKYWHVDYTPPDFSIDEFLKEEMEEDK